MLFVPSGVERVWVHQAHADKGLSTSSHTNMFQIRVLKRAFRRMLLDYDKPVLGFWILKLLQWATGLGRASDHRRRQASPELTTC